MTSDELWAHLPGSREESVHLAEFPDGVGSMQDATLAARWERLLRIRDDVNRALEAARQAKTIGNSLGAKVSLRAWGDDAGLLSRYRDDLAPLFIVSQAELERVDRQESGVEVVVSRAEGSKCPRCWRVVTSVSTASGIEGLCDRCVDALERASGTVAG
jgi:isoleucyl-tRNA synthetase